MGTSMIASETMKEIPENDFFLTPSCILGAVNPGTELLISRIYDLLGLRWKAAGDRAESQCTCCTGFSSHGDLISIESTLLVTARLWSVAAEIGVENITTACVTSFAIHNECLEMYHHEPGLYERVDRWLRQACGRRLQIPKHVVHASDIVYRYRDALAQKLRYRLVDRRTGRPLRIVDHRQPEYFSAEMDCREYRQLRRREFTGSAPPTCRKIHAAPRWGHGAFVGVRSEE